MKLDHEIIAAYLVASVTGLITLKEFDLWLSITLKVVSIVSFVLGAIFTYKKIKKL